MSRDFACELCRDRGVIAPRWQDDTDRPVLCPAPGCIAAEERAAASNELVHWDLSDRRDAGWVGGTMWTTPLTLAQRGDVKCLHCGYHVCAQKPECTHQYAPARRAS